MDWMGPGQLRMAVALIACALLQGCVPLPLPWGYERFGGRENLGDAAPGFIVPGKTTRAEVLLAMGEADGAALDESWLSYGCAFAKGGVVFLSYAPVSPAIESLEYRRLVVHFNGGGIVERIQFEKRVCQESTLSVIGGGYSRAPPCVDVTGKDLPQVREHR